MSGCAKAIEHYREAVAIDPHFVEAYNNLVFGYARQGDRNHQREVLDKAIALNRHSPEPLLNRALLALQESDATGAETWAKQGSEVDSKSAEALLLLARVQLINRNYEAALATALRMDRLPHPQYALIHYLAARALEGQQRLKDAAAQLRVFLQEEPNGARADAARKELGQLEAGTELP